MPPFHVKAMALLKGLEIIDAIQVSRAYQEAHGKHIDWHEFAQWLERLARLEIVVRDGHSFDRMARYRLIV